MRLLVSGDFSSCFATVSNGFPTETFRLPNAVAHVFSQVWLVAAMFAVASCGGGPSTPNQPPPPSVTVSVSSQGNSVLLGKTVQFTATVTGSSNTAVTWSVNNVVGGNSVVGTVSGTGVYTAPADLPSPASVAIKATSRANANASASASVAVTSDIMLTVASTPANPQFLQTGQTLQLTATISSAGHPDLTVNWFVNGVANGNSSVGLIAPTGAESATYTAPTTAPSPGTVTIAATSVADSSKSAKTNVPVIGLLGISSLDKTSADPFTLLTVTGSGFDPVNGAISVLLIPEGIATPTTVPVFSATPTSLQIIVPPIFDPNAGTFTSGTVDVQVIQASGSALATSNVFTGLGITTLVSTPPALAPGTITSALLNGGLQVIQTVAAAAGSSTNLTALSTNLANVNGDLASLIPSINSVSNNPSQTATIASVNGSTISITAQDLAIADQLLFAYITQFVAQVQTAPGSSATACGASTGDPSTDTLVCQMQQTAQQAVLGAVTASPLGNGLLLSGYTIPIAEWSTEGLVDTGANATQAANAYQLALDVISPFIVAYSAASSGAQFSKSLSNVGATLVTSLGSGTGGLPILDASVQALNAYITAANLTSAITDPGPQGGLIINDPPMLALQIVPGALPGTVVFTPPTKQGIVPISSVASPPIATGGLEIEVQGLGEGKVISGLPGIVCDTACTAVFPSGTKVVLSVTFDPTKNTFLGWGGGACGGTAPCQVIIQANQTIKVTATFSNIPDAVDTYSVSFTGIIIDHGNGGCPSSAAIGGTGAVTLTPSPTQGAYLLDGTVNLTQGSGLCDDYSGTYSTPPSGVSVAVIPGGSLTFSVTQGSVTVAVTGIFSTDLSTFSGSWGFSAGPGPDVASGTFDATKQ